MQKCSLKICVLFCFFLNNALNCDRQALNFMEKCMKVIYRPLPDFVPQDLEIWPV